MIRLIDSAVVLNDPGFSFSKEFDYITTPGVMAEFKDLRSKSIAENALGNGLLKLEEPSSPSVERVNKLASEKGLTRLSKADVSLLALALDFTKGGDEFVLVSDDYSVQNLCKLLGVKFEAILRGKISKAISFRKVCTGCGKEFSPDFEGKECTDCSAPVKALRAKP